MGRRYRSNDPQKYLYASEHGELGNDTKRNARSLVFK